MSFDADILFRPDAPVGSAALACEKLFDSAMAKYSLEQAMGALKSARVKGDHGEFSVSNAAERGVGRSV